MANAQLIVVLNLDSPADLARLDTEGFAFSFRFGGAENPSRHFRIDASSSSERLREGVIMVQTDVPALPPKLQMD